MPTVLVADDEKNILQLARMYLQAEGFTVETAGNGREALDKVRTSKPDLLVLDLMMPEVNGWEVCRRLRKESDLPIIMLTARGDDVDKIVGLVLGADDYMTKPFNARELVARVKAVLRRYSAGKTPAQVLQVGDLRIDPERHEVNISDRAIELRPKEFELLTTLARNPGVVFDRERLLKLAWGYDYYGDSRPVDVHVTWLREKLRESTARIQTVWGIGYKLVEGEPGEAGPARRRSAETSCTIPKTTATRGGRFRCRSMAVGTRTYRRRSRPAPF